MSKRRIGTERRLPFPPPQRFCAAVPLLWLEGCGRGRRWRDVLVRENSAGKASVRRTRAVLDWSSFLHRPRTCAAAGRKHHPVSLRPDVVRETAKAKRLPELVAASPPAERCRPLYLLLVWLSAHNLH